MIQVLARRTARRGSEGTGQQKPSTFPFSIRPSPIGNGRIGKTEENKIKHVFRWCAAFRGNVREMSCRPLRPGQGGR